MERRYAQNDEDLVAIGVFGDKRGTFLDIGAADGISLSNVRLLAENGWSGLLVEPHPVNFARLSANYAQFAGVKVLDAAIRDKPSIDDFYMQDGTEHLYWSTGMRGVYESELPYRTFTKVEGFKYAGVDEVFRYFPHYDFVSVDTEGDDFAIMKRIVEISPPKLFCAEVCRLVADEEMWVSGFPMYRKIHRTPENIMMQLV